MDLSKPSREFLENLRVYLISSGKNEKEIDDILNELTDHLSEAEKHGKNVDDIIGKAPKEYMRQLAGEMPIDLQGIAKYFPIVILGAFSYIIIGDAIRGDIEYSLLQLIGFPVASILLLFLMSVFFKYIVSNKLSKPKEWLSYWIAGIVPISLFLLLIYLDHSYQTPIIDFGLVGTYVLIGLASLVLLVTAIWTKTWGTILFPLMIFCPQLVIEHLDIQQQMKAILSLTSIPLFVAIYLLIAWKWDKQKAEKNTFN